MNDWIDNITKSDEDRREFERELAWLQATELVCELMEKQDVSRTELARRLGSTPPNVTQILRGTRDLKVGTLTDMLFSLGHTVKFSAVPLSATASQAPTVGILTTDSATHLVWDDLAPSHSSPQALASAGNAQELALVA